MVGHQSYTVDIKIEGQARLKKSDAYEMII